MEHVTEFLEMAAAVIIFCLALGMFTVMGNPVKEQLLAIDRQSMMEQSMALEEMDGSTW